MRNWIVLFWGIFLLGCGAKLSPPQEPQIQGELHAHHAWWRGYGDENLEDFLELVLKHNSEVNIARVTLLSALARADLMDDDLYPSPDASMGLHHSKNLNQGSSTRTFSHKFGLNYELDIYGKIMDAAGAEAFRARASAFDLQSLRLSIINRALNHIFELAYLNDAKNLLDERAANLEELVGLYALKYELGRAEELELLHAKQSLLQARQNLLSNAQNRDLVLKNLKDLAGGAEDFSRLAYFEEVGLENFKILRPDFNISLQNLALRPDVRASLARLKAAFKDHSAVQKSLLPNLSLGGLLSGTAAELKDSFRLEILSGNVALSLPFLDYAKLRQNIKISQLSYEALRHAYERDLQGAMNEFALVFKDYESDVRALENSSLSVLEQERIAEAYFEKYELGKSELSDYLEAERALNASKIELLKAKFKLFKTINSYYQITTLAADE
ncbi:TolC family protein [Campylobacter sp.]|uniref:TolC family protein n=1 Tax=Campylobacter sp. TaxID=205 RepID=UPI0026DBC975|nr:TolC family protein [Campylobacter sp.]MDO4673911.1 TolC family protein [Campylobacter sp.]